MGDVTDTFYQKDIILTEKHRFKSTAIDSYMTYGMACTEVAVDFSLGKF